MNKNNKRAFLTNFELALEGAIIAIVADMVWVVGDVSYGVLHFHHIIVFLLLTLGLVLSLVALVRHHKAYCHRLASKCKINNKQDLTNFYDAL